MNIMFISALYWKLIQKHSHSDRKLEMQLVIEKYLLAHTRGWYHLFYGFVTAEQFHLLNW